jgi:hypothetical protein
MCFEECVFAFERAHFIKTLNEPLLINFLLCAQVFVGSRRSLCKMQKQPAPSRLKAAAASSAFMTCKM